MLFDHFVHLVFISGFSVRTTLKQHGKCSHMPTTPNWGQYISCFVSYFVFTPELFTPHNETLISELMKVLSCPVFWLNRYSYAIVGINLTEMAYSLLKNGALKPHFYNSVEGRPQIKEFHQLYCK